MEALPSDRFEEVLVQHLYRYLDFTARLEYIVVNRTVLGIAHGSIDVELPEEMRFDAYKIYCDEAYHTLFSVDLSRQVQQRTGIVPRPLDEPYFLVRLRQILEELPDEHRALAEMLFVIVSETLISSTLAEIPERPDVVAAVRGTTRDHALDEGRPHAYFAAFLRYLWGQLSPAGVSTGRACGRRVLLRGQRARRPRRRPVRGRRLKQHRAVATRYDKLAVRFEAAVLVVRRK
ncbi:diiron oxygenase [Streptomyces sp. SID2888]|uniref:diiron oxygenase n=1 Tax=Streptomyces sp. SID2888 TaxID=2690256 RepID=UPI0031F71AE5